MQEYDKLDEGLWAKVRRIRGRLIEDEIREEEIAKRLSQLPARHGGLGIVSHRSCAPHAHAAAAERSRRAASTSQIWKSE